MCKRGPANGSNTCMPSHDSCCRCCTAACACTDSVLDLAAGLQQQQQPNS
jgi:hypothetical protein